MIEEVCAYCHNYFDYNMPKYFGEIVISGGALTGFDDKLLNGQYFRIVGSIFNDGIYKYPATGLKNETFSSGAVWALAIHPDFIQLCTDIAAWVEKYNSADSAAMSPFNSESFGGYSYSKSVGGNSADGTAVNPNTWQSAFSGKLARWRKP